MRSVFHLFHFITISSILLLSRADAQELRQPAGGPCTGTILCIETSAWSPVSNFTTKIPPALAPVLLSPPDGSQNISADTTLVWSSVPGAAIFHLQVSTVSDFASTVVDESALTQTFHLVTGLPLNATYYWRVNSTNAGGTSLWSVIWSFTTGEKTAVNGTEIPEAFMLGQNYPNPFSGVTSILLRATDGAAVTVKVFDALGRPVATLLDNERLWSDRTVSLDASNLPAGMHFYRAIAGKQVQTRTMFVVR
jgi:hypothetical protein